MNHLRYGKEKSYRDDSMKSRVVFANRKLKASFGKLYDFPNENELLLKWLNDAFDKLAENAFCGVQIKKKLIPSVYIESYEIDNLWKLNLPKGWRLLYSVARDEIRIISIILDWFDHKSYEKMLRY
jgi:hypothetical protein